MEEKNAPDHISRTITGRYLRLYPHDFSDDQQTVSGITG